MISAIKRYLYLLLYYLIIPISFLFYHKQKDIWLISERGDEARDNSYYFYLYIKKMHPDKTIKYVISKKSCDIDNIKSNDIVYYRSFMHYLYFINASVHISTHYMGTSPLHWIFAKFDKKGLIYIHGKKVFLQHGVTYNTVASLVNSNNDLFITTSDLETKFVIDSFNLVSDSVKCLGFARFDYFNNETDNTVLVMPTWRRNLNGISKEKFIKTDYYNVWQEFLNSKKLISILKNNGLKLLFYPHYEMQKYIDLFSVESDEIVLAKASNYNIHDLLDKCKIFITDYSSTSFDIAYNCKPIIYYPFDYDDFYNLHYKSGYFDLKTNSFGYLAQNINDIVEYLNMYIDNNYKLSDEYADRIKKFYKYVDHNNCKRIYDEIVKMVG